MPVLLVGCDPPGDQTSLPAAIDPKVESAPIESVRDDLVAPPPCADPIAVYENGERVGAVCFEQAAAKGLTVVNLSDEWTPRLFDPSGDDPGPAYRKMLIALANERMGDGPEWDRPKSDRFLELYGIFPTPRVMAGRLLDEKRHQCHDDVDDEPLEKLEGEIDPWASRERQRYEAMKKVGIRYRAITAVQEHLRCEGLLKKASYPGAFDLATTDAMRAFQRKHMIVSYSLDEITRTAFATDSRELDFRGLLRVLRERVADTTGLIEDGSAGGKQGMIVGRLLDAPSFRAADDRPLSVEGAPDLVAQATDAAATALGWTDPAGAARFFRALPHGAYDKLEVAVRLPKSPAYHSPEMDIRAEIDRGDVWYDPPFGKKGAPKAQPVEHRPTLTLYAKHDGREIALVRWPTTIGGWKPERSKPKEIDLVYKLSPPGPRVWRELFAAPAWIPPESTPKRDLVRPRFDGSWTTKTDLFGPGYASAYGLSLLVHHQRQRRGDKEPGDEGIRTHGSVSYESIVRGTSHGCHRLFNHQAMRLSSFLLAHRKHTRAGADVLGYHRRFEWQKKKLDLAFESRGYRYVFDPPVPIEVLPGRIMGKHLAPPGPQALPPDMAKRFKQEMFEE